eukprot:9798293-Alexandrium_andersonii.AAC.1
MFEHFQTLFVRDALRASARIGLLGQGSVAKTTPIVVRAKWQGCQSMHALSAGKSVFMEILTT